MTEEEELKEQESDSEEEGELDTDNSGQPRKRGAEARINELLAKNKDLAEKLDRVEAEVKRNAPIPPAPTPPTPEVLKAIESLKRLGFVHKDELKAEVQSVEDKLILNTEHNRLSDIYSGEDGRPKYDPTAIQRYMTERGIYHPEVAYKAMHEQELLDWHLKQATQKKTRPYSAPPFASSREGDNAITREKIAQMQGTPQWRQWYEANREKILSLMAQGELH